MLDNSIEILKGIGQKRKESLNDCGIYTIKDLLYLFPSKYKDISQRDFLNGKMDGDEVVVLVTVDSKPFFKRKNSALNYTVFYVSDGASRAKCTFFNQPYLIKNIQKGDGLLILGKVKKENSAMQFVNPKIIRPDETTPDIITQYKLPKAISQKSFLNILKKAFDLTNSQLIEILPEKLRLAYNLCTVNYAIEQIHFPMDMNSLKSARSRLAFEEMFFFILVLRNIRNQNRDKHGLNIHTDDVQLSKLYNELPYTLTNAQQKVIAEIRKDMSGQNKKIHVMNRLLQGDVGCGKTIVAMVAIYSVFLNGYQSAMMAPTEILANQHYEDCKKILEPLGINVALLTSSKPVSEKRKIYDDITNGKIDLVIGTHAIIQTGVKFNNLGLTITDEQHRFGVNQRALLSKKGDDCHMLVMSATPVPRTLALILYGDLDVSTIDELPPGRQKVETRIIQRTRRSDMYQYIAEQVSKDQQAYIVCPLIDESEKLDVLSATEIHKELKKGFFRDMKIGLMHGKISDDEKHQLLKDFSEGKIRVLVSTTVIEVGVNVPSATIMVIENAERFGLAQLHQLRGRVGRSSKKSWCFMTTETKNQTSLERLKTMLNTNDGFVIAQKDLELRGPGQFIGMKQSGLLDQRVLALISDYEFVKTVKRAVDKAENGDFGDCIDKLKTEAQRRYNRKLNDIVLN